VPAMRPLVPIFARALHTVALSLWLGGLVAIGALVAPLTFLDLRGSSFLTLAQANGLAGRIVGDSLFFFNIVCSICGVLLLASNFLLLPRTPRRPTLGALAVTSLLLLSLLFLGLYLAPAMNDARAHGDLATFDRLHHLYERVFTLVQFPLLLLLALFGAMRDSGPVSA